MKIHLRRTLFLVGHFEGWLDWSKFLVGVGYTTFSPGDWIFMLHVGPLSFSYNSRTSENF